MPRPRTGDLPNAKTLLSAFGETIVLEDASEIEGIFKTRQVTEYDGTNAFQRPHYVLFVPEVLQGTFAQEQYVTIRGSLWYVSATIDVGDGWLESVLSLREGETVPSGIGG